MTVPGPPRVRAITVLPCDDPTLLRADGSTSAVRECRSLLSVLTWLGAAGTLDLKIRGGTSDHVAQTGGRSIPIPAGRITTIHLKLAGGQVQTELRFDTQELPRGLPEVTSAVLSSVGVRQSLL